MSRLDRYLLAVQLAQAIAEGNPRRDPIRLQQAFDDIRDELAAARNNQAAFPEHAERMLRLLSDVEQHSVKVPPPGPDRIICRSWPFRLIKGGGAA